MEYSHQVLSGPRSPYVFHRENVIICSAAVSQQRGDGSNCLVFLKAHPLVTVTQAHKLHGLHTAVHTGSGGVSIILGVGFYYWYSGVFVCIFMYFAVFGPIWYFLYSECILNVFMNSIFS